jgi:hypothetical protein
VSGWALGLGLWPEGSDWEFSSKASLDVDGVLSEGIEVICLMALEGLGGVEGVALGLVGVLASKSSEFLGGAAFFGVWEFSVGGCGVESWGVIGSRGPGLPRPWDSDCQPRIGRPLTQGLGQPWCLWAWGSVCQPRLVRLLTQGLDQHWWLWACPVYQPHLAGHSRVQILACTLAPWV